MRLLISGGAGCLGSNLVARYLAQGHEVSVIDNFATGKRGALPDASGLTVVEGSISDEQLVTEVFARHEPTHIIHSAAAYKDPNDWAEDVRTNVLGTINLARAALKHAVQRFVYFQTALCYGRPSQIPIPVEHALAPFTSYGISKTSGELYLMQSPLPLVSLRLANICGPRLAIGPIPTFYKRLRAGQSCFCSDTIRDFLDMSDFLALMDLVLDAAAPSGVFNVSSGVGKAMIDVYEAVADYLGTRGSEVRIVQPGSDDVRAVVLDPSHTESTLGWVATVDFQETIRRQLEWYDTHGVTDVFSHLAATK